MTAAAAALAALRRDCDRLAAEGRRLDIWWRDDDAVAETPALARLLRIASAHRSPVAIATIPALAEASLAARLHRDADVTVLVHGWRHANHAGPTDKPAEFGAHRRSDILADEATEALASVQRGFGSRARAIFVPPWNRIAPGMVPRLADLGYRGMSCFAGPETFGRLARIDTHLDPLDWRGNRSLAAPDALVAMMRQALSRGVRTVGLLTHHLVFDEALWSFTEGFAELAATHPAFRPVGIDDVLVGERRPSRQEEPA